MKYHIVFDKHYTFVGTLYDKLDVRKFKQQRDMSYYNVHSIHEEELHERFGEIDELEQNEASEIYGQLMFPGEQEVFDINFDQMHIDFMTLMTVLLKSIKPYVKFTEEEDLKVEAFLQIVYSILNESFIMMDDEIEPYDHNKYFHADLFAKKTVKYFGGVG